MRYYAISTIPTEINYQNSIASVAKVVREMLTLGYEVFYSLEPFTVKVRETVMGDVNKWFRRCFGINTFIVPTLDRNDLNHVLEIAKKHGVNIAYTHERLWIKGRRLKTYCVNISEDIPLEVANLLINMGFSIRKSVECPTIVGCGNLLFLSKKPELQPEKYSLSETIVYVEDVCPTKPWHTLTYGVNFRKAYEELINTKAELYEINGNVFLEKLVVANNRYPVLVLNMQDDTILLYAKKLQVNVHLEKLFLNILAYMSSEYVKLHL